MTTEGVEILIEAEDNASAKIRAMTDALEDSVRQTRELSREAKQGTQAVSTLADAMGLGAASGYVQKLGNVAKALGDVRVGLLDGGKMALGMKAGLAGLAAGAGLFVGNELGKLIIGTNEAREAFEKMLEASERLANKGLKSVGRAFRETKEQIGLIVDPAEQQQAMDDFLFGVVQNVNSANDIVAQYKAKLKNIDTTVGSFYNQAEIDLTKQQLKEAEKLAAVRQSEFDQMEAETSHWATVGKPAALEKIKLDKEAAELAAKRKQDAGEYLGALADEVKLLQMTTAEKYAYTAATKGDSPEQVAEIERLLKKRDLIQGQIEDAKALAQQAAEFDKQSAQKIKDDTLKSLNDELAALTAQKTGGTVTTNTAAESRLLTGIGESDKQKQVAENTKMANELAAKILAVQEKILAAQSQTTITVVGP